MKYILMMSTMKLGTNPFPGWSEADVKGHIGFMISLHKELSGSGELVAAEGLVFRRRRSWYALAGMVSL